MVNLSISLLFIFFPLLSIPLLLYEGPSTHTHSRSRAERRFDQTFDARFI